MGDQPFLLTVEMIERLRSLGVTSTPSGMCGTLAKASYFGQGYVEVPAAWLVEIIDRMDKTGLPAE